MNSFITVRIAEDANWHSMRHWCEENCKGKFYTGTDWYNWQMGQKKLYCSI